MQNDTYKQYLKQRKQGLAYYIPRAKDAFHAIKFQRKLEAWKNSIGATSFYTDSSDVAHEYIDALGYRYVFKIQPDDFEFWEDIQHQGYVVEETRNKPGFAEYGNFTRHSGEGIDAWLDLAHSYSNYRWAKFYIPEKYMQQFYDNKNWGKHDAYVRMIASTRQAIENDIENFCQTDYNYISVTLYSPDGDEIDSDGLGGCDTDYCISGAAFFEHNLLENMQGSAKKHYASVEPEQVPENYSFSMYI